MNKKHWISVVLNKETNLSQLKELVTQSYLLVENKI